MSGLSEEPVEATPAPPGPGEPFAGRFDLAGRTLRAHTARGTVITGGFMVMLATLGFARRVVVAGFITASELGIWGILAVSLGTLVWLKEVGIGDKFVQQDEDDQEAAFHKAFTLELMVTGGFFLVVLAAVPVFAVIYGQPDIVAPGLALACALPAVALQSPSWIFYRQMRFGLQRALQSVDPVVGLAATISLAVAGAGVWSLVIGTLAGAWASALAHVIASPYRFRLRFSRVAARDYVGFSLPLLIASGSGIVIAQSSVLVGEAKLGVIGVGALALASSFSAYTDRVDGIVTTALYPAICAVRDRTEVLYESFVKSNRLALMWGVPFGVGLALFSDDLVRRVLGDKHEAAIVLITAYGLIAAANQLGFNWTAFYRARGDTKPAAVVAAASMVVFVAVAIPLLASHGLEGFAWGMAAMTATSLAGRAVYIVRLFPGFSIWRHVLRSAAPAAPAALAVLAIRAAETGERSGVDAGLELTAFVAVAFAATWALERDLLRELSGYLRAGAAARAG